jgi:hypothetical protein
MPYNANSEHVDVLGVTFEFAKRKYKIEVSFVAGLCSRSGRCRKPNVADLVRACSQE